MPLPSHSEFLTHHLASCMEQDQYGYDEECPICKEAFTAPVETMCGHFFCAECAQRWFQRSETCPQCRRVLYDDATIPPHWPSHIDDFDFQGLLDFWVDEAAVLVRLYEVNALTEAGQDLALDNVRIRVDYESLVSVAVAAMVMGYGQVAEDLEAEVRNGVREGYLDLIHTVQDTLLRHADDNFMSANFRELLEEAMWPGSTMGQKPEGADRDGTNDDPDTAGPAQEQDPAEAAWEDLWDDAQRIVDHVCYYATVHHRVP